MWVVAILEGLFEVLKAPRRERLPIFLTVAGVLVALYLVFAVIKWS